MHFDEVMEIAARIFEALGVFIILGGGFYAVALAIADRPGTREFFDHARRNFGRPLLLGLEVLVAADIIETITVDRTVEGAIILGILVLVRVVLSFSLDVEIDGLPPWRRAEVEARSG